MILYKSKKEKARIARRNKARIINQQGRLLRQMEVKRDDLDQKATQEREKAKAALRSGEKPKAARHLKTTRSFLIRQEKTDQKLWVATQIFDGLKSAQDDQEMASCIKDFTNVININSDEVADVFSEAQAMLGEQVEIEDYISETGRDLESTAATELHELIPSMDDLEADLNEELADELTDPQIQSVEQPTENISSRLDDIRRKLKDLD